MSDRLEQIKAAANELRESAEAEEAPIDDAPADEVEAVELEPTEEKKDRARDKTGRFANGKAAKVEEPVKAAPVVDEVVEEKPIALDKAAPIRPGKEPKPAGAPLEAPVSWKADAREAWTKAPPEIQREAIRREQELQQAFREAAPEREFSTKVRQALAPYESFIRAEGTDPVSAINGAMQIVHTLSAGSMDRREAIIANMIRRSGATPEGINRHLTGEGGQMQAQQQQDPRVDQLQARLDAMERTRQEQEQQNFNRTISDFAQANEFFPQVRATMGALMNGDPSLDMPTAYRLALQHPKHSDIATVLTQRTERQAATAAAAAMQRKKSAAVSVKSNPSGPPSAGASSRLEQIRAAAALHSGD